MAKEKPTLFRLSKQLDNARRQYAAGNEDAARALLKTFKVQAMEVMDQQQEDMAREMTHHLRLRNQLKELTSEATALAREVKGEAPE